jgi:heme/copper-type cytochrome/quinol oxidase subunit 2
MDKQIFFELIFLSIIIIGVAGLVLIVMWHLLSKKGKWKNGKKKTNDHVFFGDISERWNDGGDGGCDGGD